MDESAHRSAGAGAPRDDAVVHILRVAAFVGLALVVTVTLRGLEEPPHGAHVFRQTHVLANVDKLLTDGLLSIPSTYNHDFPDRAFDLPVQQHLCALLVRLTGLEPVAAGRVLGLAWTVLGFFVLRRLLRVTGAAAAPAAATLLFYCAAPIQVFYAGTALPDGLACLLSLIAVLAHAEWSARGGRAHAWLALMVAVSALAASIKAPVFLPAACAIVWLAVRADGWRAFVRPAYLVAGASVLLALVGWHTYAAAVNADWRGQLPAAVSVSRSYWYFSSVADRLRPELYGEILQTLTKYLLHPVSVALMVWGLVTGIRVAEERARPFRAWWCGCVVMILVFFNLCWRHSYYLLPCVAPFAYWAASGLRDALSRIPSVCLRVLATVLALASTFGLAAKYVSRLHASDDAPNRIVRLAGTFLRDATQTGDFVVYVVGQSDHQPQHLYFARRDGYMVSAADLSAELLARIWDRYVPDPGHGRRLVFVPDALRAELEAELADLGLREIASGPEGVVLSGK